MKETVEFRVVWQREGFKPRRKRYATRKAAERFMTLLGPEPWVALGRDPDEYFCCSGAECGCSGLTIREESNARREEMPKIESIRLETRRTHPWELVQ